MAAPSDLDEIIIAMRNAYGVQTSFLFFVNDFTLLLSIMLSANVTDVSVNKVTNSLWKTHFLPEHFLSLSIEEVRKLIRNIGLYTQKSLAILDIARVVQENNGQIPRSMEELTKMRGVGRKTANVYLNIRYGESTIGIDTHVARVSKMIGIQYKNISDLESILTQNISKDLLPCSQLLIVYHGRHVCKARKPMCDSCCIRNKCSYYQKTLGEKIDKKQTLLI